MFTDDRPHPEWEMTPETQRKLALGVAVIAGLIVLMNLLAGSGPNVWDQLKPSGVAHYIEMIRFG